MILSLAARACVGAARLRLRGERPLKPSLRVVVPIGFLLAGLPIHAHHAISEIYDVARTLTIEGEVESFLFENPHSVLHVKVQQPNGHSRTWAVEWRAADRLRRQGLDAHALKRGEVVTVCGNPGRDPGAYRLYLLNVSRLSPGTGQRHHLDAAACSH